MTDLQFEAFPTLPFEKALEQADADYDTVHYLPETRQRMAEDIQWNHWANAGCAVVRAAIECGDIDEGSGYFIMSTDFLPRMNDPARNEPSWQD